MALITGLFALIGRLAGRILNSSLGWATILLFGKVSGRRQTVLSLIALGSLAWVIVVIGVLVPAVAVFLLAAVTLPSFIDDTWIRIAMLAAAVGIPILVGIAALSVEAPELRPGSPIGVIKAVLRGYPFTLLLALTIAFLAGISLAEKVVSLARRQESVHVPLIIKPRGYEAVLRDLEDVLERADIPVDRAPAPVALAMPPRLLARVAGRSLGGLVPDRLVRLRAPGFEVLVYPSDLALTGTKPLVARARAAIAERLTTSPAYLTTTAVAERVEDDIMRVAAATRAMGREAGSPSVAELEDRLAAIDRDLASLTIDFDEWETLYRERLQVERDLLAYEIEAGGRKSDRPSAPPAEIALGLAAVAAMLVDVVLLIVNRVRPQARR